MPIFLFYLLSVFVLGAMWLDDDIEAETIEKMRKERKIKKVKIEDENADD